MELRNRLYPYPILNYYSDDFQNSHFEANIKPHVDEEYMYIEVDYTIKEETIENLLEENSVELISHIECPTTSFREVYRSNNRQKTIKIRIEDIDKELQINFFVVAKESIENYTSPNFNDIYEGLEFYVDRHTPLAIAKQINIPIDKDDQDLKNITSIFTIIRDFESKENRMTTSIDGDKIEVYLPDELHKNYGYVVKDKFNIPLVHSILLQPVLVDTFREIKHRYDELRDYKWCKSLIRKLMEKSIISKEDEVVSLDGMTVAQQLLNDCVAESLDYLFKLLTKDMTDDED